MAEAVEVHAKRVIQISKYSAIWRGDDGNYYQVFDALPPGEYRMASPECQALCGHKLRRIHWTCLFCRIRRVAIGELPPEFPVKVFLWTRREGRWLEGPRDFAIKKLMNLVEFLAA